MSRLEPHLPDEVLKEQPAPQARPLKSFRTNPFSNDDGSQPQEFTTAKAAPARERLELVVRALVSGRVLSPVLPHEAPEDPSLPHADDCENPEVLETLDDGRVATPIFTSADALAAWNPQARPLPVYGSRAAQLATTEVMVLDPGDDPIVIPRSAIRALAVGQEWIPAWKDPEVSRAAAQALADIPEIRKIALVPGQRADVAVVVMVNDDVDRAEVESLMARVSTVLSHNDVIADRIDSLELFPTTERAMQV